MKHCVTALWLLLLIATPALAERQNIMDIFSLDIPGQYECEGQYLLTIGDDVCNILLRPYLDNPDALLLAHERAAAWDAQASLRRLAASGDYIYNVGASRVWLTTVPGWLLEVTVPAANENVPAMLSSLQAAENYPALNQAFAALNAPEVINWLSFKENATTPAPPCPPVVMPDFSIYGVFAGQAQYPAFSNPPAGWRAGQKGNWAVMMTDNGSQWCAMRYCPLAPGDMDKPEGDPPAATALLLAEKLNGRNITFAENTMIMTTPAGQLMLERDGDRAVITLTSDYSALEALWELL